MLEVKITPNLEKQIFTTEENNKVGQSGSQQP